MTADEPFAEELRVAVEAAHKAGEEVARLRREGVRYGHKDGHELVSEADLHAAEILRSAIIGAFPGDGWLSEEHTDTSHRLGCERAWIVDPIDGTREYLQGVPEYSVSVGLAVEGEVVLGVVYNPAAGELDAAVCAGIPEREPSRLLRKFDVLVGRGEHRWDDLPPLPREARPRGVGSVAYRLALIARGKGDSVITASGRSEWDVAAGAALCKAAGLRITDILGDDLQFNKTDPYIRGLIAAEPGLHHQLDRFFVPYRR